MRFEPVSPNKWGDFKKLFGERGACGGCWCQAWRLKRSEYNKQKGPGNRQAMEKIIMAGEIPGILAYSGNEPVAWCSVNPREKFPVLEGSRVLKPVDDQPVWSITCFFIDKRFRSTGISIQLLKAAVDFVRKEGCKILEGYPVEPKKTPMPAVFAWTGFASAYRKAGFTEVARRSETRPIMRYYVK